MEDRGQRDMVMGSQLACAVLAHADPRQLRRLIAALDPLTVILHVDASTPDDVFHEMTAGLPDRVLVTPRVATGWATFGAVAAELIAYEWVLERTSATHVAWMSGADYPIISVTDMLSTLDRLGDRSFTQFSPLPIPQWSMGGGMGRLRYYHWAWRGHVVRLPVPRRIPVQVRPAGGPAQKILSRRDVTELVRVSHERPDIVQFWRRVWAPDETFSASVLSSPALVPGWGAGSHVQHHPWWIDWGSGGVKSPPWLDASKFESISGAREQPGSPPLFFARKVGSVRSDELLDALDDLRETPLRAELGSHWGPGA